jgi:hypothetical protein
VLVVRAGLARSRFMWQNDRGFSAAMALSQSIWVAALALAASAPWSVRVFADRLEARVRRRTEALILRARAERTPEEQADQALGAEEREGVERPPEARVDQRALR